LVRRVHVSKKWGAVLRGHDFDLADWRDALKSPYDPWVELHEPDTILCSASFDEMTSADEVRSSAVSVIERLNGAMAVYNGNRPVRFGGVAEILAGGQVNRTIFVEMIGVEARARVAAVAVVLGPDGKPKEEQPRPSQVQNWAVRADTDDHLGDAL